LTYSIAAAALSKNVGGAIFTSWEFRTIICVVSCHIPYRNERKHKNEREHRNRNERESVPIVIGDYAPSQKFFNTEIKSEIFIALQQWRRK
jgi:hypothetical protein